LQALRRRSEFEQVFASGKFAQGRCLALRYLLRGEAPTRVGFAVGKRLDKRAVVRNRVRRQLRSAIRDVPVRAGYDIVVLARRAALGADFTVLKADVRAVFSKAALLEGEEG